MKLMEIYQQLHEGISKREIKSLNPGDTIWLRYHSKKEAIPVQFVEFIPGSNGWKDRIKIDTDQSGISKEYPLSLFYLEDPGFERVSNKKGFMYKGIQGNRKWK